MQCTVTAWASPCSSSGTCLHRGAQAGHGRAQRVGGAALQVRMCLTRGLVTQVLFHEQVPHAGARFAECVILQLVIGGRIEDVCWYAKLRSEHLVKGKPGVAIAQHV